MPFKMLVPEIHSRVKQSNDVARNRIDSGNIGPFRVITPETGKCEIFQNGLAEMFERDDVIDFVNEVRIFLGK